MASTPEGSKQPNDSDASQYDPEIFLTDFEKDLGVDDPQEIDDLVDDAGFEDEYFPEQYGDFGIDDIEYHRQWADYWFHSDEPVICLDDIQNLDWMSSAFDQPRLAMFSATVVYRAVMLEMSAYVHVEGLDDISLNIEDLRAEHLTTFQTFETQVSNRSATYPRVHQPAWKCPGCGVVEKAYQPRFEFKPQKPSGDCGCDVDLIRLEEGDGFYSAREVLLQDLHRRVNTPEPADVVASVDCDLVASLEAGETVRVGAIVRADTSSDGMTADYHLQIVGIDHQEEDFDAVDISSEEREEIHNLADRDDIHSILSKSIAPHIIGKGTGHYSLARRALLYQLAGGVPVQMGDEEERGVIHTALVGDPGVGKSDLANAAYRISPKSEKASGESTTAVGFTATAHKEDRFRTSEWTVTGGVLPRAHGGLAFIDELDKAKDEHQEALHTPMSECEFSVNKASINATLAARTSVLVVANPDNQRFDPYESLTGQIGIKDALLSRFDIVIPFIDEPDSDIDNKVMSKYRMASSDDDNDVVSEDLMRKYLAVAREIDPELTSSAIDFLEDSYSELRSRSAGRNRVSVTARKGEAMRRLAQASARLRHSDTVEIEDMERARDLLVSSLELLNENGELDADRLGPGPSADQREAMTVVEEIVQGLHEATGSGVEEGRIIEAAEEQGVPKHKSLAALARLERERDVWHNHMGYGPMDD